MHEAIADARARSASWLPSYPDVPLVVRPVPEAEAVNAALGYYRPPAHDGRKPAEFFVNVAQPPTRARYDVRVLVAHEAIPGHHIQEVIGQSLAEVPSFRKYEYHVAYIEGWGLYAESLAGEMGLYRDDLDRLGALGYDAWRTARLVVDTGLHAMGWTRAQAVAYLAENTMLSANNVDNEVDRYLVTPGQALAYKIGQLEISRLRRKAESELGGAFQPRAFHSVVLGAGPLSLGALGDRVDAYIAATKAAAGANR
jgi:uncharacterized protein (DUF885 family)